MDIFMAWGEWGRGNPAGLFVVALAGLALAHSATALSRSRQWTMLPVAFTLTALAGFLINPLADANTMHDLKARLTQYDVLTLLCITQFLLVAVSACLGLRIGTDRRAERPGVWLSVVSVLPAPALVIAMLLLEQVALAAIASARPEVVGRNVGLGVASILLLAGAVAFLLPDRLLAVFHGFLSLAFLMACMFLPFLGDPLPQTMTTVDWESLRLLGFFLPAAVAAMAVGYIVAVKQSATRSSAST